MTNELQFNVDEQQDDKTHFKDQCDTDYEGAVQERYLI